MLAAPAWAQDSTTVAEARRDTSALVAPTAPASGRALTPVPAVTPSLDLADLLARRTRPVQTPRRDVSTDGAALSTFAYGLGAPAHLAGLSLDALAPERAAATLDGRPLDDLFTGAPRLDLLPWEATGRLALTDAEAGAPVGIAASLRPFRERVPVTELRFHTGRLGVQFVSGTHAQTHRVPWGIGGERARMTATIHVGSRQSDGAITGARLRHAHVLARVALATPRWGAELTEHYAERTEGARRGVLDNGFLFDPLRATPLDASAARRTLRNEVSATLRAPLVSRQPLALWTSWTRQVSRYSPGSDTLSVEGNRYAAGLTQRLGSGPMLRAWAALEDDPWGRFDPLGDGNERLQVHAALADTLRLGRATVALRAGGHLVDGTLGPALAARAWAGPVWGAVSWTGVVPGRIEDAGLFPQASIAPGVVVGLSEDGREQVVAGEVGARARAGAITLGVRPFARLIADAYRLLERENVETAGPNDVAFGYGRALEPMGTLGATASVGWREAAESGLYVRSGVTAQTWPLRGPTEIPDRVANATPALHGSARLGFRATRVGTGTAALDLGTTVRGWSAFRGVRVHPATGLLALARRDAPLLPARALLDLDARVTFGTRAAVSVVWANVLSGLVYDGARTVQAEPLPGRHLRFGVFWAFTE